MKPMNARAVSPGVQILHREACAPAPALPKKRVAAYCRVSTDMEQQASSLETQLQSFRKLITSQPGWELVDIYADEGLSGTRAANRGMFQQMIADCEAGKIDYIVTKSISRFARNTMDCLQYVRKLKELGVYVYFDENHLDTGGTSSEMLLSILAAVAQEESHSISENMKWGMRKRFQEGKPKWVITYGFIKGEDGEYGIYETQAKGVRRIFELYVSGRSLLDIARILEREGIPAMNGGKWWPKTLATVLHNEKYVGDIMMQKTYTIDHLSHKKVKNDQTIVPSYYVRDHHAAIVDRKTYDMAQMIAEMKDAHQGCSQYPYRGALICPYCGGEMVCFRMPITGHPGAWTCGGFASKPCPPYAVYTKYIDRALVDAYSQLDTGQLEAMSDAAARVALEWKRKKPRLEKVEYILLSELISKISFPAWSEAVIHWRFGLESHMPIAYAKVSDIPNVEIARTSAGYTANGAEIARGSMVRKRVLNMRESSLRARATHKRGRNT